MRWVIRDLWHSQQHSDLINTCPYLFSDSWSQTSVPYMDSHIHQHCFREVLSYSRTRAKKSGNGEDKINWGENPFLWKRIIYFMTLDLANKLKCWNLSSQLINCPCLKNTVKLQSHIHIRTVSSETYLKSLVSMVDANDTLSYVNLASQFNLFIYLFILHKFYNSVIFGCSLGERKEPLIPSTYNKLSGGIENQEHSVVLIFT